MWSHGSVKPIETEVMLNTVQPVSLSSPTVGPLFPAGVTFLWSGPRGGSHNNSHLSQDHTLSNRTIKCTSFWPLLFRTGTTRLFGIPGISTSLYIFPQQKPAQELRFLQVDTNADAHPCGFPGSALFPLPVCLAKTNVYLLLVLRSLKICLVQPLWFMI